MKKHLPLIAAIILFLLCLPLGAQIADTTQIGEASVTAYRPVAKIKDGALITTIENTPLATVGTADDVLQQIPGLAKKTGEEETFEVIGKGAPLIYINGRQVRDLKELKQLRSDEIKAVELIQTPGARYDASVKAVVRIRTIKRKGEGFGLMASQQYNQGKYANSSSQLKLTYRKNNLDLFASFDAWVGKKYYNSVSDQYTATPDTLWVLPLGQNTHSYKTWLQGTMGFNYDFDKEQSVGVRYEVWRDTRDRGVGSLASSILANGEFYDELFTQIEQEVDRDPNHSLNAYYTGKWGKGTFSIDADFVSSGYTTTMHTNEASEANDDRDFSTQNPLRNRLFATKAQYEWPWLGGKVTVGGQFSLTNRHDDYFITDESFGINSSRSHQRETVEAAFVEYSAILAKRWQLTAGLRYEHADYNYWLNDLRQDEQSPTYDNLFPSLSLATAFGKGQKAVQFMLAYTSKTDRPSYQMLSRNVTYGNRFLMQSGNPLLKPTLTHSVNATAVWKFIQASVDFTHSKDGLLSWGESLEGNPAVTLMTGINHNYSKLQGMVTFAPHFGFYQPQWTAVYVQNFVKIQSYGKERKFNNPLAVFFLNNGFQLPKDWHFNLIYRLATPGEYQNIRLDNFTHNLQAYVTKSFFHDALTLNVGGTDLLKRSMQKLWLNMAQSRFHQYGESDTRQFYIRLAYNFNAMRSKYKGGSAVEDILKRL